MTDTPPQLQHPRNKLNYANAIQYTERWLEINVLPEEQRGDGWHCTIYDYHDRDGNNLKKRPWTGVRVAEVDFHNEAGGTSFMQTIQPWGIAVCGQVERCILALVEGWNSDAKWVVEGDEGYWQASETDEEFWRLGHLFEEMSKP
jgi:hypothetical protein